MIHSYLCLTWVTVISVMTHRRWRSTPGQQHKNCRDSIKTGAFMESLQFRQGSLNIRWILFIANQHQVCKDDGGHRFHYYRSTKGEADIVAAWNFEGIHLAGCKVEGLLRFADA